MFPDDLELYFKVGDLVCSPKNKRHHGSVEAIVCGLCVNCKGTTKNYALCLGPSKRRLIVNYQNIPNKKFKYPEKELVRAAHCSHFETELSNNEPEAFSWIGSRREEADQKLLERDTNLAELFRNNHENDPPPEEEPEIAEIKLLPDFSPKEIRALGEMTIELPSVSDLYEEEEDEEIPVHVVLDDDWTPDDDEEMYPGMMLSEFVGMSTNCRRPI